MPDPLKDMFKISLIQKSDGINSVFKIEDFSLQFLTEKKRRAIFGLFCRFDQTPANTFPFINLNFGFARKINHQNFCFSAGLFLPIKPRRNDLGVIDHQNIR